MGQTRKRCCMPKETSQLLRSVKPELRHQHEIVGLERARPPAYTDERTRERNSTESYERKWKTNMHHNQYQELFDRQKRTFASGVTRTYDWRVDQLDHMAKMITENEEQLQTAIREDFKTATQEYIFETFACVGEVGYQKSQL